ncbi:MAG: 2-succinyl-5-enolpyruvyl-6-hydroxy-3-cyclohexene-1-carboxylic-acid synthase [Cyanobacteria bacterium QH_9_48_43]|nr:MAG: 2-succinyl-5-enolpyruvyl-6-hydroxy-3-cyclohexene-1-carboxylic-acid synthase [Cyanobacteria bacterium QS_1_48_34]PSO81203.1 MAG: 2-succinyl-5-enolpyruvyl-6-hydroxy-3-cyclohexene-1-carboxylic-acid synthase [Cyanobacteria bacterium QS_5_48_63]PSO83508.1 MAG: 2-succinyl-5-enolpyruvyl-6-hydroxy-3-cyclohexene-1-carboxylic-acid synthase [Cyanobacteria bacterium QH_9_48_43]PSP05313.1 MAG: 2-succinyl-5-enolpyruvyl-6-hydroxy-3-cyclohexene-1-carboxylic-acid synthase [Cyanobacteria bacterium SW_12_4
MPLDFRNTNTLWSSIIAETLKRLGLTTAIICPGSRSAPLTVAFAQHPEIEAIPILDERSAAFFALGVAKRSHVPAALVCTSGTAGANFYPAVIEASESQVPLLVLTADRPPELRDCHAGQAIDQQKLYGSYPNWQAELALPSQKIGMLRYLRQTIVQAVKRSLFSVPGAVHLNVPFREPLAPTPQPDTLNSQLHQEDFFTGITLNPYPHSCTGDSASRPYSSLLSTWKQCERGIIIAGVAQPQHRQEYCQAITHLSQSLGWAVLAEGLSPVRNYAHLNPYLISTYDLILGNPQLSQKLAPEMVIQLGALPTSKELRAWLNSTQPQRWIIDPSPENFDPLHGKTTHLHLSVEQLATTIPPLAKQESVSSDYLHQWRDAETQLRQALDKTMATTDTLFEGKAAWLLSQTLPPATPLLIANSMPVRDVEFFWKPNNSGIQPFCNRGANGIEGSLSTALGIAHHHQSSVMLTGDLALLHDTNGFLQRNRFTGHLTIVLINNNGGGIFEMLPISQFEPPFQEYFATPQEIDFAQLCGTYGIEYKRITNWQQLQALLNPLPEKGIRVLEIPTNRREDAKWRQENMAEFAANIAL